MSRSYLLYQIYRGLSVCINILDVALLARCIFSWIATPNNRLYVFLVRFTEPLVAPFRRLSMKIMQTGIRLDLSVLFAMVALSLLQRLIGMVFTWIV